jgi:hypothetical protein
VIIAYPQSESNVVKPFVLSNVRTLFLALCLLLLCVAAGDAAQVTVGWDPNTEPDIAGYKVYYGTVSRNYSLYIDAANLTSSAIPNLQPGQTYYIAVSAYTTARVESDYSNEVTYRVPLACTYSISPASQSFNASGGTGAVSVTTQAGCNWTASGISWVTITSGASGTGSGTVTYSIAANTTTSSRTVGASVASQIFTATQTGAPAYTISASGGTGGSISPSGSVLVASGSSQAFSITPAAGYRISSVTVDGSSVGAVTAYTFSTVTANHTIAASFAANSYALTVTRIGTGTGTVTTSPSGTSFTAGTVVTLTATPAAGSAFVSWSGGCSGTTPTCQVTMNSNTSVSASFAPSVTSIVIEAENASIKTAGGIIKGGWNLWSNGILGENVRIPAAGTYGVVVRAYGTPLGGIWPLMALSVDGVAGAPVTVGRGVYTDYSFQVALAPGDHSIGVAFLNDAYNPGVEDRNLFVDKFSIYSPPGIAKPELGSK